MTTLLIVLIVLLFLGSGWGYHSGNRGIAFGGGGLVGLLVLVLLILFLTGNLR